MNWGGWFVAFCSLLRTFPAVGQTPSIAGEPDPLSAWARDISAAADFLRPEHRVAVREDIWASVDEAKKIQDKVLHVVWPQLFKLGSLVFDDLVAWEKLNAIDIEKYAEALDLGTDEPLDLGTDEPPTGAGLSEAVRRCTYAEEGLEEQAARTEYIFHQALRAISLLEQQDLNEVQMKYASLRDFLRELNLYFTKRRGPLHLIQRKTYLVVYAIQGDRTAQSQLISLDKELQTLNEALKMQEAALVQATIKCYEQGLLFRAVVTFLNALRAVGSP